MARAPTLVQHRAAQALANDPTRFRIPILQQTVRQTTHEGVARSGGIDHVHFVRRDVHQFLGSGDQTAIRAERDRHQVGPEPQQCLGDLFVIAFAGQLACGGLAGLQDIHQSQRCSQFFLRSQAGSAKKSGRDVEIKNHAHLGIMGDVHGRFHRTNRKL